MRPPGLLRLAAFRFVGVFLGLRAFPFPLDLVPVVDRLTELYGEAVERLAIWVGTRLLGITSPIGTAQTGSGDRLVDWLTLALTLAVALVVTTVWTAVDRKDHDVLRRRFRVYLRYALATAMLGYGFAKVWKTQFPDPTPFVLQETYGESSPMRLLWTFMGYSPAYNTFTGLGEVVGGLLLLAPRTATLGALVTLGVMSNVVVLNLAYDVPVKLYSTQLLLTAAVIAWPDAGRLLDVLVRNRPAPAADLDPPEPGSRLARTFWLLARIAFFAWVVVVPAVSGAWDARKAGGARWPIVSAYRVIEMSPTGPRSWDYFEVTNNFLLVRRTDGSRDRYFISSYDAASGKLAVVDRFGEPPGAVHTLHAVLADGILAIEGTLGKDAVRARLRPFVPDPPPLMTRGFHWISEAPYNR